MSVFSPALFDFLDRLTDNNQRDWFKANQKTYEADVRGPALDFVRVMGERLSLTAPHLLAVPKKVGGSLMRPQRDTRFSKDKTPYKLNVGIQFRHEAGKDVHAPGLYVHLATDEVFVGLGMYRPDNPTLHLIRAAIDADPERWERVSTDPVLTRVWSFGAEDSDLKRVPRGYDKAHRHARDLRRKSFILVRNIDRDVVLAEDFPDQLRDWHDAGKPLMQFICEAIGQAY